MEELGIKVPSSKRIPDKYITSSSQLNSMYPAFRGRIGVEVRGTFGNAWCAAEEDADPFIQVYFELLTKITVLESEGVIIDGNNMWIKSYTVSINNDSTRSWTEYPNGNAAELQANNNTGAKNTTLNNAWTHFIRIHPRAHEGKWTCLRIALYGCQTGSKGPTMYDDVLNDAPISKTPLEEPFFLALPIVIFACVIIAGLLCYNHGYRPSRSSQEKQSKPSAEARRGISDIIVYEEPPPYESQTVSLHFGHDSQDGKDVHSEMPDFSEANKIFSFGHVGRGQR